ncbi:MAG: hypothetical protein JWP97_1816, partial [Labilithrix sp.]|nr:hypothetical protein [Labilithrix sp.]
RRSASSAPPPTAAPPAAVAATPPAPPQPARTAPEPANKPLREPSRELFLPVANAAIASLARASKGYLQGLFVVTLDPEAAGAAPAREPRRLIVQLVVIDGAGILRALDPPSSLIEAAVAMVEADRREGNASWRKLSARVTPKPDGGATLQVDVT